MGGDKPLTKTEQRWELVQEALQQFEIKIGLGGIDISSDVDNYTSVSQKFMERMSEQECAEAALLLSQEATFVQLNINRLKTKMEWCDDYINRLIAPIVKNEGFRYLGPEYKRALSIQQNDVARELEGIRNEAARYHSSLSYIPTQLRHQADKFTAYQQTKRG